MYCMFIADLVQLSQWGKINLKTKSLVAKINTNYDPIVLNNNWHKYNMWE